MDNSDYSRNRHNEHLGVNKIGKNIKKSPLHQPNFGNQQQPQPRVYNINKNDFRNIVQQLTGSPSQEPLPYNSPKPPSMRLQRIRPPPLSPINGTRPRMLIPAQPPPPPMSYGDHTGWPNTAESPISAYMRYLQHSINDSASQTHLQPQVRNQHMQVQQQLVPHVPSPRTNGYPPLVPSPTSQYLLANMSSPPSPYPLHPPPLTPIPMPQPPPSPGFFSVSSPRWRN